ncbi:MAG: arylformamidase [Polaribacter sp.]|jgi:arylformamidase
MIDWNDAFDNSGYILGAADLIETWSNKAAAYRQSMLAAGCAEFNIGYGNEARNKFDLFIPEKKSKGLVVFVHGGFWHMLDKSYWSHLAKGAVDQGWSVAIPSYTLAPDAKITQITQEIAIAISCASAMVDGPIRLVGHSAGGHLVTRMVCVDSPLPTVILPRVSGVVSISGIYDLRPLTLTNMNQVLGLTDDEAIAESPAFLSPRQAIPICFWVGDEERPEFLRQNRLICEVWLKNSSLVDACYQSGKHHFSVIDDLAIANSPLIEKLTAQ